MISATRYHDFSAGHRVVGHEGKCKLLHGHNYRIHFTITSLAENDVLDEVGRVIDFSIIKVIFCDWLEQNWDHRFLVWSMDPLCKQLVKIDGSVVIVPFNPTAENMAIHLVTKIGPTLLLGMHVMLKECTIEETRKCSVTYSL